MYDSIEKVCSSCTKICALPTINKTVKCAKDLKSFDHLLHNDCVDPTTVICTLGYEAKDALTSKLTGSDHTPVIWSFENTTVE